MTLATVNSGTIARAVDDLKSLPPLPGPAAEILDQFGDEFLEVEDVTRVVERDPGITARLLGLANSAFFNLPEPVTRMEEAISRVLGVDTVRSIVFAMALRQAFDSSRCPQFRPELFWLDALCVAEGAKKLARDEEDAVVRALAYPAGLCHNLGLLALVHLTPAESGQALADSAADPCPQGLVDRLRASTGTDHRAVTADLAAAWQLPDALTEAYAARAGRSDIAASRLALIVRACSVVVGNRNRCQESRRDIDLSAEAIGLGADELLEEVQPGQRQLERLGSVAESLKA